MRSVRALAGLVYGLIALWPLAALAVNANPVPGSLWTYLGPTLGADWLPFGIAPLNITGLPSFLVNPPAFNSIVSIKTLINADPIQTTPTLNAQEEVMNLGMLASSGQGQPFPGVNKVAFSVGIQGLARGGELWAENLATFLTPTYNTTDVFALVSEMDTVKDGNAGSVDPRPGKAGLQFPTGVVAVPIVPTNGTTSTSSNVLSFAVGTLPTSFTLAVGATLRDITNPAAIALDTYVTAFSSTSITMSANAAATVNSGDQIAITIVYTYGLILESCCNQASKASAAIVMSGAAPWYRGAGCDSTSFLEGCFYDYSVGGASYSMQGTHTSGIDMTNANISGHPINLPGGAAAAGYIGLGDWRLSSIGGDPGLTITSLGGTAPSWTMQTVVSAGTLGRLRFVDNPDVLESFAIMRGNPAAGGTDLQILINNTEGVGLYPITLGAPSSCGAGFRCLVVPN